MGKRIITVTHPDGTKKIIVGQNGNSKPVSTSNGTAVNSRPAEEKEDKRPKPGTPKISISKEKNGYKYGGKVKLKLS